MAKKTLSVLALLFSVLLVSALLASTAAATTYVIEHNDESEDIAQLHQQVQQKQSYDLQEGMLGYMADMDYRMHLHEQREEERYEDLMRRGTWYGYSWRCSDWSWRYDYYYARVSDNNEFFRFIKSCKDHDWDDNWRRHGDGRGWDDNDGSCDKECWDNRQGYDYHDSCWGETTYQGYVKCRNHRYPNYDIDETPTDAGQIGRTSYNENAYDSWRDQCRDQMAQGHMSNWCFDRMPWLNNEKE